MRILLDEQLPRRLGRALFGHDTRTVQQQGWSGISNGELLRRAAAEGFDVLLTADQNLQFQQNLAQATIAVMVLIAPTNKLDDLLPLVPAILAALPTAAPGRVVRVGGQ